MLNELITTGDLRVDVATLARFLGRQHLPEDESQNIYLGGGNISVNNGLVMYVKLSGEQLAIIGPSGFGEVNIAQVTEGLAALDDLCTRVLEVDYTQDFDPVMELDRKVTELFIAANSDEGEPSVEAGLHAQLKGTPDQPRWNIHTHNTIVNAMLCSNNAYQAYQQLFGNDPSIQFMDFVEPGAPLSLLFNRKLKEWQEANGMTPDVVLLANHGIVVTATSPREVVRRHAEIIARISNYMSDMSEKKIFPKCPFRVRKAPTPTQTLLSELGAYVSRLTGLIARAEDHENDMVMRMLYSKDALKAYAQGALNPDAAVYGGPKAIVAQLNPRMKVDSYMDMVNAAKAALRKAFAKYLFGDHYKESLSTEGDIRQSYQSAVKSETSVPRVVLFPGICTVTVGNLPRQAMNAHASIVDTAYVMRGSEAFGGPHPLSERHQYFISHWGAEKRREKKASGGK